MIAAGIIMLVALSIVLLVCITDDRILKNNNKNMKTYKVRHKKTGNIYEIIIEGGKMKIGNEWKPSVTYIGKDKYTGKMCCFTREKEDFNNNFEYIQI